MSTIVTDETVLKNIAKNVVRVRKQRKCSQYRLAKSTGSYPANISRIEKGESMPGAATLARIAAVLETTMDELISNGKGNYRKTS